MTTELEYLDALEARTRTRISSRTRRWKHEAAAAFAAHPVAGVSTAFGSGFLVATVVLRIGPKVHQRVRASLDAQEGVALRLRRAVAAKARTLGRMTLGGIIARMTAHCERDSIPAQGERAF